MLLTVILPLVGALLLTLLCGMFVLAEFSLITVDRSAVQKRADEGSRAASGVLGALHTLSSQLSGTQVGITLTTLAVGFLAQPALARVGDTLLRDAGFPSGGTRATAGTLALVVSTATAAVVGELIPKNIAIAKPLGSALAVQGFQRGFTRLARPIISACNGSANAVLRLFGVAPQEELASARSPDELASLVRRSAQVGTLPAPTAAIVERTLAFGTRIAEEVMTPRTRVRTLAPHDPVATVVDLARSTGLSRFPIVESDREDVVGIVGLKEAVGVPLERRARVEVGAVMEVPVVVPSSISLDALLERLRDGGHHLAVVVDEFGGWDGIVSVEDLVEELVGDVFDEHDRSRSDVVHARDGSWSVSGLLRPDEVAERTGLELPEDTAYETVAGLLVRALGRLPVPGDAVTVQGRVADDAEEAEPGSKVDVGVQLTVVGMDRRRVDRLRIRRLTPEVAEGEPVGAVAARSTQGAVHGAARGANGTRGADGARGGVGR